MYIFNHFYAVRSVILRYLRLTVTLSIHMQGD